MGLASSRKCEAWGAQCPPAHQEKGAGDRSLTLHTHFVLVGPHGGWGAPISLPTLRLSMTPGHLSQYGQAVLEIQSQTFHALGSHRPWTQRCQNWSTINSKHLPAFSVSHT